MEVNENDFFLDGTHYRAEPAESSDRHQCDKCDLRDLRECDYREEIPDCDADYRKDGRAVIFKKVKNNFEKITASPEALATFLMHDLGHSCECSQCPVDDCDGDGDCILLFQNWLVKEVDE